MGIKTYLLLTCITLLSNYRAVSQANKDYTESIELHRKHYKDEFLKDKRSPLKAEDLDYLDFYDADIKYKLTAEFKLSHDSEAFEMPTYSGKTKTFIKYGTIEFVIDTHVYSLAIYKNLKLASQAEYQDYLFIPFKDLTSGKETYGGGRYIDLRLSEISKDNKYMLDFNKCYNPYCAYAEGYNCPVPPYENHLAVSITAGEKQFKKAH